MYLPWRRIELFLILSELKHGEDNCCCDLYDQWSHRGGGRLRSYNASAKSIENIDRDLCCIFMISVPTAEEIGPVLFTVTVNAKRKEK